MRLTRLQARDWMAYALLDVDFADLSALAITGENNMGKSAVQNAVTMALYGRVGRDIDQRSADLLVRRGTEGFMVRVEFTTPTGHTVEVTREKPLGRTMTLGLVVDGVSQRGHIIGRKDDEDATLDETQARIEALVGLSYDALVAGPFMVQQGAESASTSFLKAKPAARKDLLIRLLNLDVYERLWMDAKRRADEYAAAGAAAATRVAELDATVKAGEGLMADLEQAQGFAATLAKTARDAATETYNAQSYLHEAVLADRTRQAAAQRVDRATQAAERGAAAVVAATALLEAAEAAAVIPEPEASVVPVSPTADEVEHLTVAVREAQDRVNAHYELVGRFNAIQAAVESAERARAILPTVPCGGVGEFAACQFLRDVPPADDVETARASLERTRATLTETETAEADLNAAKSAQTRATQMATAAEQVIALNAAALTHWNTRQQGAQALVQARRENLDVAVAEAARVRAEAEAAIADLTAAGPEPDLTPLREASAEAQRRQSAAEQAVRAHAPALLDLEKRAAVLEDAIGELAIQTERHRKAERIVGVYRTLEKAWHRDGIPTSIIEASVPLIEAKANTILERFPQDLSVSLRTQRPTKGGKMAEKLDIVVTIGGEESDPGLLSVGANFRLDIALRMALSDLQGARIETLWLDEPLAALDATGREAVVSTLSALSEDFGLMVAVSHHPDFTDALPARLDITQEAGVATATLS